MWISSEEARSDFVLAAAAMFLGVSAVTLIARIPIYPLTGLAYFLLSLMWLVLLGCGAPWWLARYRNDIPDAFGLGPEVRGSVGPGLVLAAPLVIGYVLATVFTGDFSQVLLSLAGRFQPSQPSVIGSPSGVESGVLAVAVAIVAIGSAMTGTFLAVRGREAFRSPDMDVTELLRTFGMGGVGATLILGLLQTVRDGGTFGRPFTLAVALLIVVLMADQYVPARVTAPRAAIVGPAIVVLVLWVLTFGGPFRGDLLLGLYSGTASAVLMVVAAAMLQVRNGLAAAILLAVSAIYPVGSPIPATEFAWLHPIPLHLLIPFA